jgi:hypothetical protein
MLSILMRFVPLQRWPSVKVSNRMDRSKEKIYPITRQYLFADGFRFLMALVSDTSLL